MSHLGQALNRGHAGTLTPRGHPTREQDADSERKYCLVASQRCASLALGLMSVKPLGSLHLPPHCNPPPSSVQDPEIPREGGGVAPSPTSLTGVFCQWLFSTSLIV